VQKRLVVVPHSSPVGKNYSLEKRAALLDRQKLVDLLLVFGDGKADLGVIEDKSHLLGDRILVDRHRHAAQRLGCSDRPVEPRPIIADDREPVAAAKPHR